jgi:hypothetical protein
MGPAQSTVSFVPLLQFLREGAFAVGLVEVGVDVYRSFSSTISASPARRSAAGSTASFSVPGTHW